MTQAWSFVTLLLAALVAARRPSRVQPQALEEVALLATAGGGAGVADPNSFVQTEMRKAAMKLHTRDQAREGEQQAQKPMTQWTPGPQQLLQFLVDSQAVHAALDAALAGQPALAALRGTGLERGPALEKDIAELLARDPTLALPPPSPAVEEYAQRLVGMAQEDPPAFVCHFYNTHFAHTAGGVMIGRWLSGRLLGGTPLHFYQYDSDVQPLLAAVRGSIDAMAAQWTPEQRQRCVDETAAAFRAGGAVLRGLQAGG